MAIDQLYPRNMHQHGASLAREGSTGKTLAILHFARLRIASPCFSKPQASLDLVCVLEF